MVSFDSYWCLFDSPVGPISAEFCSRLSDEMLPSCGHGNRYRSTEVNSSDEPRLERPLKSSSLFSALPSFSPISAKPLRAYHKSKPFINGTKVGTCWDILKALQLAMSHHISPFRIHFPSTPRQENTPPLSHLVNGLGAIGHEGDLTWPTAQFPIRAFDVPSSNLHPRGCKMIHNDLWSSVKS